MMPSYSVIFIAQVLKKFGAVNLPVWYEAGKYAQESSPIPFSECSTVPHLIKAAKHDNHLADRPFDKD